MLNVFPTIAALRGVFINFKEEFPEAKDLELKQMSIFEYWKDNNFTLEELTNSTICPAYIDCSINFPPVFNYNPFDEDNKIVFVKESLEYISVINAAYNRPDEEVYEYLRTNLRLNAALYAMVKREGIESWKETEVETTKRNEMFRELHNDWQTFKNSIPDYIDTEDEDKIFRKEMLKFNHRLGDIIYSSSNWSRLFSFAGIIPDRFKNISYDICWKYINTDLI